MASGSSGEERLRDTQQASGGAPTEPLGRLRDYELLEKLGQGGMGTVYKARHVRLKREVALKVLPQDRMDDEQSVARFNREMEAVGKLQHSLTHRSRAIRRPSVFLIAPSPTMSSVRSRPR